MKNRFFPLILVGILIFTQSPVAFAQGQRDWSSVQAVGTGERLIVKQKDGETIEGGMIEANESNLTLSRKGKVINISRDNIRHIHHSTGKAAKAKWALIGAGIGGAAGAGIGVAKASPNVDDSEIYIPIGLVIGAGAGAVTGLFIGQSRRQRTLIYQAP